MFFSLFIFSFNYQFEYKEIRSFNTFIFAEKSSFLFLSSTLRSNDIRDIFIKPNKSTRSKTIFINQGGNESIIGFSAKPFTQKISNSSLIVFNYQRTHRSKKRICFPSILLSTNNIMIYRVNHFNSRDYVAQRFRECRSGLADVRTVAQRSDSASQAEALAELE